MDESCCWDGVGLGTSARVVVVHPGDLDAATDATRRVIADIDITCSRFRDDSEISRMQARADRTPVRVSRLLMQALTAALDAARFTDGDVDPTVGAALSRLGYAKDFSLVAASREDLVVDAIAVPGWQCIVIDDATSSVSVPRGVSIDLGATAKGLASDLAARAASDACDGRGVLVALGGDIAVAGNAPDGGWGVLVAERSDTPCDARGDAIAIRDGGVATSSTTVRRWRRGNRELHHIVDPRSGLPTQTCWRSVTVVASTCLGANIASTASIVRGDAAIPWLESLGVAAQLVATDGSIATTSAWPA